MAPPVNDDFANATDLGSDASGSDFGSNVDATIEAGEPDTGSYGDVTAWWKWTCPVGVDTIVFKTLGSTNTTSDPGAVLDTVLFAYDASGGPLITDLVLIDSNDDGPIDYTSELTLAVTSGVTYYFKVDGYSSDMQGDIVLAWGPTPLDITFDYTGDVQEWTPERSMCVRIEATGASAQAFGGSDARGATAGGTFHVTAGVTYYIYVGQRGQRDLTAHGPVPGGWPDGGDSGDIFGSPWLGFAGGLPVSGGGSSDVRKGGTALSDRIIVGGAAGGGGGPLDSDAGIPDASNEPFPEVSGLQSGPGTGSPAECFEITGPSDVRCEEDGHDGSLGQGGAGGAALGAEDAWYTANGDFGGAHPHGFYGGAGAGGGYYGGGGGGGNSRPAGGGSSWVHPSANDIGYFFGSVSNGQVHIFESADYPCTALSRWHVDDAVHW